MIRIPRVQEFGKDVIFSLLVKISGLGIGFIIQIFLARVAGIQQFGNWNLAASWINLFVLIALLGHPSEILRKTAIQSKEFMNTYLIFVFKQSQYVYLIIAIAFIAALGFVPSQIYNSPQFLYTALLALLFGAFNIINRIIQASMSAHYMNFKVHLISIVYLPVLRIALLYLAFILSDHSLWIIAAFPISEIIIALYSYPQYRKLHPKQKNESIESPSHPKWNAYLLVISVVYLLLSSSDIIILSFWCDEKTIGGYAAASRLAAILMVFCTAFSPFLPKISQVYNSGKIQQLQELYLSITKIIYCLTLPLVIYYLVFGKWMLGFFGEEFVPYVHVLSILSLGVMMDAFTGPIGSILIMTRFEKYDMILIVISTTLNIILNVFLIPQFGPIGAAFSTMLAISMVNVFKLLVVHRIIHINTISFRHILILAIGGIFLFISNYIEQQFHFSVGQSIAYLIGLYIIFTVSIFIARLITLKEIIHLLHA